MARFQLTSESLVKTGSKTLASEGNTTLDHDTGILIASYYGLKDLLFHPFTKRYPREVEIDINVSQAESGTPGNKIDLHVVKGNTDNDGSVTYSTDHTYDLTASGNGGLDLTSASAQNGVVDVSDRDWQALLDNNDEVFLELDIDGDDGSTNANFKVRSMVLETGD